MKMSDREKLGLWLQSLIYPKKFKNSKKITKQTGQEEGDDTEGGYLVDHALLPVILAPNFAEGKLYADCTIFNLGKDNVNGARIPRSAETSRTNAGLKGGVNAYWKEEGETKLASIAKFDIIDLGLDKLAGVVYLTDEVKQDPVLLVSYMSFALKEAIMYKVDRAIVYGVPGEMAGIALDPATGAVAISAPIAVGELKDIFDLYYGGAKGKWYVSKGIWNEITDLYDDPTIPLTFGDSGPMLWGMPVVVSDVFDERDLMLGDLSQYLIIQKEITSAISIHLKYLEDESVMRFVLRINGQGLWTGPITLQDTSTVHPFVMTTGGEMSSSSSSSSSEQHSSSSSSSSSSSEQYSNSSNSSSSSVDSSSSSSSSSSSEMHSESTESSEGHTETSLSTQSSSSSVEYSSSSSSSSSELHSESSVSSESSLEGCASEYCATDFSTAALNGAWVYSGSQYNGKPYYTNGSNYMWYDNITYYWAISNDLGDPQISWLSTTDTAVDCPSGDIWVNESGIVVAGNCSSSSSSVDSSSSSSEVEGKTTTTTTIQ